ncbi:hypothetical protein J7K50_05065 [bacterium]|nr:hypothetical protein [bacterium]
MESVEHLAGSGKMIGDLPLLKAIDILVDLPSYNKVLLLAGMETYSLYGRKKLGITRFLIGEIPVFRFKRAVKAATRLAGSLFTPSGIGLLAKADSFIFELSNSPFTRGVTSDSEKCSFFCGFLRAAIADLLGSRVDVEEVTCAACSDQATTCKFAITNLAANVAGNKRSNAPW